MLNDISQRFGSSPNNTLTGGNSTLTSGSNNTVVGNNTMDFTAVADGAQSGADASEEKTQLVAQLQHHQQLIQQQQQQLNELHQLRQQQQPVSQEIQAEMEKLRGQV